MIRKPDPRTADQRWRDYLAATLARDARWARADALMRRGWKTASRDV